MQRSFFAAKRHTGLAVVLALIATLFSLGVSESASAVETRRAVTGLMRLSSGVPADGYVDVYKKDDAPATTYQAHSQHYVGGVVDIDLEPGTYKFEFYSFQAITSKFYAVSPATGADIDNATPVVVSTTDRNLGTITFAVRSATVTVKDGQGVGIPNMTVTGSNEDEVEFFDRYYATTNANGVATFRNLPTTQPLYLRSTDDRQVKIYDDSNVAVFNAGTTNVVANLTQLKRSSIKGKVTGTGGVPLSLVTVKVYNAETGNQVRSTATDSQGNYEARGLKAGTFVLEFVDELGEYAGEFYNNIPPNLSSTATQILVTNNFDVTGVNVQLAAEPVVAPVDVDLTGVVRGQGNNPLSNVEVNAYRNGVYKGSATTGRDGRYAFSDLTSGSYQIEYRRLSGPADELPYVRQWYLNSRSSTGSTPVAVSADSAGADKNQTLPQFGVIKGAVTGDANEPILAEVTAVNIDGNEVGWGGGSSYQVLVPPGTYHLRFFGYDPDSFASYVPEWYNDKPTFAGSQTVTVGSGSTVGAVNAQLTKQLVNRTKPVITGKALVGRTLTASPGTWNLMADNQYTYTWLRGATVVGTGPSYVVKTSDVLKTLSVRVDAVNENRTASALSASTAPVRRSSVTTLTGTSPKKETVRLVVRVTGTGLVDPAGTVTFLRGTKVVKSKVDLVNGLAVITVGNQPAGKRTYKAVYSGASNIAGSSSAVVTISVKF